MTLHPQAIGPVPEETARVARAACPKGNPYLAMRDLLGPLCEDQQFVALFPPPSSTRLRPLAPLPVDHLSVGLSIVRSPDFYSCQGAHGVVLPSHTEITQSC